MIKDLEMGLYPGSSGWLLNAITSVTKDRGRFDTEEKAM